jgi:hypothetical protein
MSFETDDNNSMSLYDQADILFAEFFLLRSLNALALSTSKQQTCPVLRVT